ncbi:MAG: hypothetical protein WC554_10940 [Clostridia bacterium]
MINFWKITFWKDIYYDLKWEFWAYTHYRKIVKEMRPWDGQYIYQMTKHQLELLLPEIENGNEVDSSRLKKVKDIKRLIELLNNTIEDNYFNRCEFDFNYEIKFEDSKLVSTETPEQRLNNSRAIKESVDLQKAELKEIGRLYSKVLNWWD